VSKADMPGFTAESGLYSGQDRYQNCARMAATLQVIPQVLNRNCWERVSQRTYWHCRYIGYDWRPCVEVAVDLANSVCDYP
jgi:hypothetical protein